MNIDFDQLLLAHKRISKHIHHTPVVESKRLNQWTGHRILFKSECLQKTGSFKVRGALNALLKLKETNQLPERVVANSSGNHAQAVAYAASVLGIKATICAPKTVSGVKAAATLDYGAELLTFDTRKEVDEAAQELGNKPNCVWLPPYAHEDIICGQGTATIEAIGQTPELDAIFAPCGGGGLLSGTYIASRGLSPHTLVMGAEPLVANDVAESLRIGTIQSLPESPATLADGAATLSTYPINFNYLQQLDDFFEVDENAIAYWTQWLNHLLKLRIEPTSAMSMEAVFKWLKTQTNPQTVLVILTGGNIDSAHMNRIYQKDHMLVSPQHRV